MAETIGAGAEGAIAGGAALRARVFRESRANPVLAAAFAIVGSYLVIAIFAPLFAPDDPNLQHLTQTLLPPSGEHLVGTDQYGRDLLSRLIFGIRSSVAVSIGVVLISAVVGTISGMTAGFLGGITDGILMRVSDVLMAFPSLVLALGLIAALGSGVQNTIAALTVTYIPVYARIVRGSVLVIKQEAYIEAARSIGVDTRTILRRHVLPNVLGAVLVQAALTFAFAVLSEAGLSFLGLGVPAPAASFGNIIANGRDYIFVAPWITAAGGFATVLLVLGLLLIADGLRDALDPYQHGL